MPFKILEVIRGSHWAALRHFRHLVKRQFDYVACQQLRRSCGLHGLYSRLWTQDTLLLIIQRLSRRFLQRQRHFLVGLSVACPTTGLFSPQGRQWRSAEAKLPDKFMLDHKDDVDHAKDLTVKTLTCAKCQLRLVIDQKEPGQDKYNKHLNCIDIFDSCQVSTIANASPNRVLSMESKARGPSGLHSWNEKTSLSGDSLIHPSLACLST